MLVCKTALLSTMTKLGLLPKEVVESGTITIFKKHLDKYMDRIGLEG